MKLLKYLLSLFALLSIVGWGPFSFFSSTNNEPPGSQEWLNQEVSIIKSQASNIDSNVLRLSLVAYLKAHNRGIGNKDILTIIDYSKPSTQQRLWSVNLRTGRVLFNTWVSHGRNSGTIHATSFSNQPGSLKSSIGLFLTERPYIGNNGYSLRLTGLERGINDNAYRRNIVVHGAWYAHSDVAKTRGQLGRSWGCPAVSEKLARPLIDTIKGHTLVFVYSNDRKWLKNSFYVASK